jgi:hypothetical protein
MDMEKVGGVDFGGYPCEGQDAELILLTRS